MLRTAVVALLAASASALLPGPGSAVRPKPVAPPRSSAAIAVERLQAMKEQGGLPNTVAAEKLRAASRARPPTMMVDESTAATEGAPSAVAAAEPAEPSADEESTAADESPFALIDKATNIGTAIFGVYVFLSILGLNPYVQPPTPPVA